MALILWVGTNTLHNTLWQLPIIENNLQVLKILCLIILALKELINFRLDYSFLAVLLFCILATVITYNTKDISIIVLAAFIIESRNIEFSDTAKTVVIVNILIMVVTIYASLHGILDNRIFNKNDGTLRYGLGFIYTTYPSQLLFFATAALISIRKEKIKIIELLVLLGANLYLYIETKTVNPFVCGLLLIFATSLIKINIKLVKNRLVYFIGKNIFLISALMIFSLTIFYNNFSVLKSLDQLVSNRLRLGNAGIVEYGISILGQNVTLTGSTYGLMEVLQAKYNYIDSSYIQIAVKYGIVLLGYLIIGFGKVQKRLWTNKDIYTYIALIAVAMQAMLDPQLIMLQYNPFILILGTLIVRKEKKDNDMLCSN